MEPGAGHVGRGRGRSRDMMGRGGTVNRMSVDHRPRALAILGVTQEEKEELMPHFVVRTELLAHFFYIIYFCLVSDLMIEEFN